MRLLRPKTLQGHLMDLHGNQDQTPDVTVTRRVRGRRDGIGGQFAFSVLLWHQGNLHGWQMHLQWSFRALRLARRSEQAPLLDVPL